VLFETGRCYHDTQKWYLKILLLMPDHLRLRHDESEAEKFEYIRRNPVRAGLIRAEDEWPYVLFGESSGGSPETPAGD